jgi:hypothetical protein
LFPFLCFVDCATLYNLVNKTNLVYILFLVYLSISTCFGRLFVHYQEKNCDFCDTLYLLFCMYDCMVCRVESQFIPPCISDRHPHTITSTMCRTSTVVSPDDESIVAQNIVIDKYTKNKLCTKLVLFTKLFSSLRHGVQKRICFFVYVHSGMYNVSVSVLSMYTE